MSLETRAKLADHLQTRKTTHSLEAKLLDCGLKRVELESRDTLDGNPQHQT